MYFRNYLKTIFATSLFYCICYCESRLHESHESNILISLPDMKSVFLNNVQDTMLMLEDTYKSSADVKDCTCKDGRCEQVCAEWKDGSCRKTKLDCVCDPEFVKVDEQTCIYCDCGKGFNCTYDRNSDRDFRICTCPDGFYNYFHDCAPFCSASKPCQNGGTCQNGKCHCKLLTHGPFCEHILNCAYECRPRLIVDCVYNQEEETYGCLCKNRSLVFDYREWVCKPCPCGEGTCTYSNHQLKCNCKPGYQEFKTLCKKCDCGPGHDCKIDYSGEKICHCRKGYFAREGTCLPCDCGHEEATCGLDSDSRKICECPKGYEHVLGLCQKRKVNCNCRLSTENCIENDDGFKCICKEGYTRKHQKEFDPEEPCTDIDECYTEKKCQLSDHQICINLPGSYICQCESGYEPVSGTSDGHKITCVNHKPSWLPIGITIGVVFVFIAISVGFVVFLKKKESPRVSSDMQVVFTR